MKRKLHILILALLAATGVFASGAEATNPILPGFNPDPSWCRVGDDYYLVTSSFQFQPGLPVYHSRDLVNWTLISHAIDETNLGKFNFVSTNDNDGIWAPTLRYHDGRFYIVTTLHGGGENFVLSTDDPRKGWGDPVWIPDAAGIDPTLFWDDDGKCYYLGNRYDFKQAWTGQVGVWIQEIDLATTETRTVRVKKSDVSFEAPCYRLVGKPTMLSFGHAANAKYAEGPHLCKVNGRYLLLMAEGGSGKYHAVTAHWSDALTGPYTPQQVNPVLSHRQFGKRFPIQNVGHADLLQLPNGDWYAVCLANRHFADPSDPSGAPRSLLGRETWLCKAAFEDGQLLLAPGEGRLTEALPEIPLARTPAEAPQAKTRYTPTTRPDARLEKITAPNWSYETTAGGASGRRGLIVYRTRENNFELIHTANAVELAQTARGKRTTVARRETIAAEVRLAVTAEGLSARFSVNGEPLGEAQSLVALCDDTKYNKFNGPGVGYLVDPNAKANETATTPGSEVSATEMNAIFEEVKTPYKYGLVVVGEKRPEVTDCPTIFRRNDKWYMTYFVFNGRGYETHLAESDDLLNWTKKGKVLSFSKKSDWDAQQKGGYLSLVDNTWGGSYALGSFAGKSWMTYFGSNARGYEKGDLAVGVAYTEGDPTTAHEWQRLAAPVLSPKDETVSWWDCNKIYKSLVMEDTDRLTGHRFVMYYNAKGEAERIGMAVSDDMEHWQRFGKDPVLDHGSGITGDAQIVKMGDLWVMFYFGAKYHPTIPAWNSFAASRDLVHWTDWSGEPLVQPSEDYDCVYAHKSYVIKWNGVVYHFYCACDNKRNRGIALATSKPLGTSTLTYPKKEESK